ncbi:tannase and feruloyl esterase [Thozetella sp. PMI_491]|nr:tannase and feruloyl esterase [Thozetella sp. PMI_491]
MGQPQLQDICKVQYIQMALPAASTYPGLTIDKSSVQATLVTNSTVSGDFFPTSTLDYCNVTFAYSHDGLENDIVHVSYLVPPPANFKNRYLSTGGGGLAINSGLQFAPSGIIVGAVSGQTDGGFGSFNTQWDAVFLAANNTINWQSVYMFGYQAHHELAVLGKQFTKNMFSMSDGNTLRSYYQGCSEGGREGWSQAQRFTDEFDGLVNGAPAFRYGQQQVNHLVADVIEQTLNYFPPTCELDKIMNMTIEACDILDGRKDGVVARSDLCGQFDLNSTIGAAYSCDAAAGNPMMGQGSTPAQEGKVTAQGVAVVSTYLKGLHDSRGGRAYISYQPGSSFMDAYPTFDSATNSWKLGISQLGGEWVAKYLMLQNASNLENLNNVTYDTLKDWMVLGQNMYADSLQTTHPDLTTFSNSGSKIIHLHGEQDNSIPTGSSVHYYDSVRTVTYPNLNYEDSVKALDDWYRLFLVPGGAHCSANPYQPNGGWPQTTLQTLIEWVESNNAPNTLNNTGGSIDTICKWPQRPLWSADGGSMDCVDDQSSIDSFTYKFDAYKLPLY